MTSTTEISGTKYTGGLVYDRPVYLATDTTIICDMAQFKVDFHVSYHVLDVSE